MEPQSTPNTQMGVCHDLTRGQANGPETPVRYAGFCVFGVLCGSIFMGPSITVTGDEQSCALAILAA